MHADIYLLQSSMSQIIYRLTCGRMPEIHAELTNSVSGGLVALNECCDGVDLGWDVCSVSGAVAVVRCRESCSPFVILCAPYISYVLSFRFST